MDSYDRLFSLLLLHFPFGLQRLRKSAQESFPWFHISQLSFSCCPVLQSPNRNQPLLINDILALIKWTRTTCLAIFLERTDFSSKVMWSCQLRTDKFTGLKCSIPCWFQNKSLRTEMAANVSVFLMFSRQRENERLFWKTWHRTFVSCIVVDWLHFLYPWMSELVLLVFPQFQMPLAE